MTEHSVIIAGGGPTGLMLAAELALAGVDVAIVERRENQDLTGSRAGGLHSRTLEVLDQRGIVDRFLAEGQVAQTASFAGVRLDISSFPSRYPFTLGLWQKHIERLLSARVAELDVTIYRAREVIGFAQDDTGVDVLLRDGGSMRAQYLVGCDGGRSAVRKAAGIEFPGWDATVSSLIAECETTVQPPLGVRHDAIGIHGIGRLDYTIRNGEIIFADTGPLRIMVTERSISGDAEPTARDLSDGLVAAYGTDFGVHNITSLSRFTDVSRQAAHYRDRRVLLAGDAAHVHAPDGGQGLNTGVQDAVNLGWKLAQVVQGTSAHTLLDSYHAERHPVAARVLRNTMSAVALRRSDARTDALRATVAEFLSADAARITLAAEMTGLGIHYDLGDGHPLLGRRMPDLDIVADGVALRVYSLLHNARPVLINFGRPHSMDIAPMSDRVRIVDASYDGAWELPAIGAVTAPRAVLVRPDGYVAWVGDDTRTDLMQALAMWFGSGVHAPQSRPAQAAS